MVGITLVFFYLRYRKRLKYNAEFVWVLQEYNARNFIPNVPLLYRSITVLLVVMVSFVIVPPAILPPSIIALLGGVILVILSRLDPKEILKKIDFDLLLYLLGVFVITGALETVGIINLIGDGLKSLSGDNAYTSIMITLWVSAYLSANIDNIPITKVLIPVVRVMNQGFPGDIQKLGSYALAIGGNWGDNLTPMGDNLIVVALAEKGKRPIRTREFFKLGFITTNLQLFVITVIYSLFLAPMVAYIILAVVGVGFSLYLLYKTRKRKRM
jgi:Na+/H+ antiporter NhaD/arsenite permease-like protein